MLVLTMRTAEEGKKRDCKGENNAPSPHISLSQSSQQELHDALPALRTEPERFEALRRDVPPCEKKGEGSEDGTSEDGEGDGRADKLRVEQRLAGTLEI